MNRKYWVIAALVAIGMGASAPGFASEMVYHPVSPTFGGNPLNGSFLLSTAQAQGEGVKSGPQGPDLSGLDNALGNLGSGAVIIGGNGGSGSGGNGGSGSGGTNNSGTSNASRSFNASRSLVP
jgi:curli production assembly/transport component CsgF